MNIENVNGKPDMLPLERTALSLSSETDCAGFNEPWVRLHDFQMWRSDREGAWCDDATGYSYDN